MLLGNGGEKLFPGHGFVDFDFFGDSAIATFDGSLMGYFCY